MLTIKQNLFYKIRKLPFYFTNKRYIRDSHFHEIFRTIKLTVFERAETRNHEKRVEKLRSRKYYYEVNINLMYNIEFSDNIKIDI